MGYIFSVSGMEIEWDMLMNFHGIEWDINMCVYLYIYIHGICSGG